MTDSEFISSLFNQPVPASPAPEWTLDKYDGTFL